MLEEYRTTDIILASCLKMRGFNLREIELNGTKGTFVFEQVDQSYIREYDLGKVLVEPMALNTTIRQLTTSVRRML